jgi:glycosyltransferase involved in cell wall biosynthesis
MNNPRVSIIVPIFEVGNLLHECIESILEQSESSIEIVCINDASNDDAEEILRQYARLDNRIVISKNKKNMGTGYSRNKGIERARGEYIRFVDSDDVLPTDSIKILLTIADKYKPEVVRGDYEILGEAGGFKGDIFTDINFTTSLNFEPATLNTNFLATVNMLCGHWAMLFNRNFLINNNLCYNSASVGQDSYFLQKVFFKCKKATMIKDCVYLYRIRQNSATTSSRNFEWYRFVLDLNRTLYLLAVAAHSIHVADMFLLRCWIHYYPEIIFPGLFDDLTVFQQQMLVKDHIDLFRKYRGIDRIHESGLKDGWGQIKFGIQKLLKSSVNDCDASKFITQLKALI